MKMSDRPDYLIRSFEAAVLEHADLGAIPFFSDDPHEQRAINAERKRIKTNYTKARNRLLKHLRREPQFSLTTPCNPEPLTAEEEAYHRKNGTIV